MEKTSSDQKELQGRFIAWAKENNVYYHPNLNLFATFENGLRGVETLTNIDKGTLLMEIPESAYLSPPVLLSPESLKTSKMNPDLVQFLRSEEPPISPWLQIVLVLMHELSVHESKSKKDSSFAHYFNILPKRNDMNSILFFKQDELDSLKGTSIENLTNAVDMTTQFESNVLPILKRKPEWWPESVQTLDAFKYCASLITSRAFHDDETGDGPFLIPGVDLLNHDSNECQTHLVRTQDKKFKLEASRYIGKGEQLFTVYGALSNAQLLHTYGFLEEDNKYDHVFIPIDVVLQQCQEENTKELFDAKKECLSSHGYLPKEHFIISKEDMLPEILLTTIQVFFMDAETFDEYKQEPMLLGDFSAEEEEDEDLMVNVYKTLIAIIDAKLATYPTTLRTDLQILSPKSPKISENMRNAIRLRLEEKKLLSDLKAQFVEEIVEITQSLKEEEEEAPKKRPNKNNNNKKRKNEKRRKH